MSEPSLSLLELALFTTLSAIIGSPLTYCYPGVAQQSYPALKGSAADKEDISCVDLDKVLMRMFAPTLRWHISDRSLNNFEQGLLNAFARDIACNRRIVRFTGNLIDLVNIDNAAFRTRYIEISRLDQA